MTNTYTALRSTLARFISENNSDAILTLACRRVGTSPGDLSPQQLPAVLDEISDGIRLFCPPERFADMMLALAALAE